MGIVIKNEMSIGSVAMQHPAVAGGGGSVIDSGDLYLHWDTTSLAYMTSDANGVSQITDRGSNGINAVQSDNSLKPTFSTDKLVFNGAENMEFTASPGFTEFTVYVAFEPTVASTAYRVLIEFENEFKILQTTNSGRWGTFAGSRINANTTPVVSTKYVFCITGNVTAGTGNFWLDGVDDGSISGATWEGAPNSLGSNRDGTNNQFARGNLYKALIYNTEHSQSRVVEITDAIRAELGWAA